ncbi:hypothetical protein [Granulicella paludicola]|uniref:hypothetical protein n=1 Tax=Granulicella paludicola TaxID=474951 RepID=UPI0021DFFF32|nr:hypothetical protein [Granulicella paludicola]
MAATITTVSPALLTTDERLSARHLLPWRLLLPLLTLATLLIDGYHPFAEDGGVYVAGIEYLLNPQLFPHYTVFVTAHLKYSIFAPGMAVLVHITHLPLGSILLPGYIFSLWLLLYAGLQLLKRCEFSQLAQLSGVALLAAWSTLPVAGTSLMLIDPYLTARSFTTPLTLLACAFALDQWSLSAKNQGGRSALLCGLCLVSTALLHPLMAVSALAIVVFLRLLRHSHAVLLCSIFAMTAVLLTALVHRLSRPDAPSVSAASLSRYYWFLSQWQWFELCGLLGPIAILGLMQWHQRDHAKRQLCRACLMAGGTAIALALLFAHAHSASYLIARLQPLRVFLPIYAVMALLIGGTTMQKVQQLRRWLIWLPVATVTISGAALFFAQRNIFPVSHHIELPWQAPVNPWSQAFVWVRSNTAKDALFALDADYITTPGEDAQTFRATAQRSALPDFSKDGGEASITPALTGLWQQSLEAQFAVQNGTHLIARNSLSKQNDAERDAHLRPLGVTWMVLLSDALTDHRCPYNNGTVKVCQLT